MPRASRKRNPATARFLDLPVNPGETLVSPGDMHYPIQDAEACDLFIRFCSDIRPDLLFLQGDTFDTASLSSHRRSAKQILDYGSLGQEAESAQKDLARLAKYSRRRYAGPGNHEERIYAHIDDTPALHGMEWNQPFRSALGDYEILPRQYVAQLGHITLMHGHTLKGCTNRYSAATVLQRNPGQNTFYGHTHRVDQSSSATWSGGQPKEYMAATIGHLGDITQMDYTADEPWRLGFGVWKTFRLPDRTVGFTFLQHTILRTARGLVLHSPLTDKVYS